MAGPRLPCLGIRHGLGVYGGRTSTEVGLDLGGGYSEMEKIP